MLHFYSLYNLLINLKLSGLSCCSSENNSGISISMLVASRYRGIFLGLWIQVFPFIPLHLDPKLGWEPHGPLKPEASA